MFFNRVNGKCQLRPNFESSLPDERMEIDRMKNIAVNLTRIISMVLLLTIVGSASICSAFEVWIGTSCTPHNAAVKPETWANTAKHVTGLNINLAPCKPAKDTPSENETACTRKDSRIILAQYGDAAKKGMVPIPRSAIRSETRPDKPLLPDFLAGKFKEAEDIGYGIGSFMFYNNRLRDVTYQWTVEEIQAMRDWLNANGHAKVTLAYNARKFSEHAKAWCQNPLVQDILLEGEPGKFYDNKGKRQELVKWLWTDTKTANKRLIFQIPVSGCENPFGDPSGYQQVRRFVRWLGTDLMDAEFLQSSRVILLPVTYNNPTFTFYPETTNPEMYANTLTGIVLSLYEQKKLFEQRTRIPTAQDADSYVRSVPAPSPTCAAASASAQIEVHAGSVADVK